MNLGASLEVERVLDDILQGLERVIDVAVAIIILYDDVEEAYRISAVRGHAQAESLLGQIIPPAADIPTEVVRIFHADGTSDSATNDDHLLIPLTLGEDSIGYLAADYRAGRLSADDLEMINAFATQSAMAIANAHLYMAQQEEAWVTTALLQVAEAVNAQVELTSTLQTIVRLTPLLVGVRCCAVLRRDETNARFYGAISYGLPQAAEDALAAATFAAADHPYLQALVDGAVPLPAGPTCEHQAPPMLVQWFGTPDLLGLPLTAQGRQVGVMLVDHPNPGGTIDQRRMNILTGIAWQTAIAIENGRLQELAAERQRLERDLEVAQSIQTSFLPDSTPSVPGWEVAAYYRAARMVGGDFYDFLPLSEGKWGVVVADVADKGMPAALYMALSRTLLRAVARNQSDPAATLLRVNKLLLEDTHSDLFVTMWYAIWNPAAGTLQYSSAGHNPPFVLRSGNQTAEILKLKGIALGVLPEIHLESGMLTLEPGDMLVLYTDGVTEAQSAAGAQFSLRGLIEAARRYSDRDARQIITAIIDTLDAHTQDAPQFDDLTLVIVQRRPESAR